MRNDLFEKEIFVFFIVKHSALFTKKLFFLWSFIFINDIDSQVSNSAMKKYNDDLQLWMLSKIVYCVTKRYKCYREMVSLQKTVSFFECWEKLCNALLESLNLCNKYFLNECQVERVSCAKDSGISLSDALKGSWSYARISRPDVKAKRPHVIELLRRSFYSRELVFCY